MNRTNVRKRLNFIPKKEIPVSSPVASSWMDGWMNPDHPVCLPTFTHSSQKTGHLIFAFFRGIQIENTHKSILYIPVKSLPIRPTHAAASISCRAVGNTWWNARALLWVSSKHSQGVEPISGKLEWSPIMQHNSATDGKRLFVSLYPVSLCTAEKRTACPRETFFSPCVTACTGTVLLLISAMGLVSPLPYLLPPHWREGRRTAATLRGHISNK